MRYKLTISYDGSCFHGFQRQNNKVSVQETIENALKIVFKKDITIKSAGRTDAGVHALNQVVHFDAKSSIPLIKLRNVLNKIIAPHIYIKSIEVVDEAFHSRLSPHIKEYRYYISTNEFDPLKSNYLYFYPFLLDISKIKEVIKLFIGTKDFKALSKRHEKENTIRTITSFEVNQTDGIYEFIIKGNGFLHNMVRIMIAIILKVNENKISTDDVKKIIESCDRKTAPWCAPANGLYLYNIYYLSNK